MSTTRPSVLVALLLTSLVGCKPGVGSSCEKGEARCLDNQRQLVCQQGKFIETPCRGPGGCALQAEGVRCDISGNRPGDACSTDEQGAAACSDGQNMLSCRGGRYVQVPCRGPNGCQREGDRSLCDQSVANPGDDCSTEGTKACSSDGRQILSCMGGKMAELMQCRGQRGCAAIGTKLDCDLSIAELTDRCDAKLEGHVACSPDGAKIVRCQAGRFVLDEECKAGKLCVTRGTATECVKPE